VALAEIDLATWWEQIAWVPQRPALEPGTVLQNLTGVFGGADQAVTPAVAAAAAAAGLDQVVAELPSGWATRIGQGGVGLSVGQRQRLGLARAFLAAKPLVVLDEPTAHLDGASEQVILETINRLHAAGRTVLLVAHRPSLLAQATDVVTVAGREVAPAQGAA
jgi:ATP-binding cassette subfamily C protein CydD